MESFLLFCWLKLKRLCFDQIVHLLGYVFVLAATAAEQSFVGLDTFLFVAGILKCEGALGRTERGSFLASITVTFCLGMFLDPLGRVGLLGESGIRPLSGQISTRRERGGLEVFE